MLVTMDSRWWKTMMKPAAQRRRGALGWVVVLILAALALFTLVAVFGPTKWAWH